MRMLQGMEITGNHRKYKHHKTTNISIQGIREYPVCQWPGAWVSGVRDRNCTRNTAVGLPRGRTMMEFLP